MLGAVYLDGISLRVGSQWARSGVAECGLASAQGCLGMGGCWVDGHMEIWVMKLGYEISK